MLWLTRTTPTWRLATSATSWPIFSDSITAELLMTGRRISGAQAVAWGLALGTGDSASALEEARVLAGRIGAAGPVAVRMAKRLLREGGDAPLAAGLQLEQAVGAVLYGTDDAREGIAAFVAKRRPRFDGH